MLSCWQDKTSSNRNILNVKFMLNYKIILNNNGKQSNESVILE